MNNNLDLYILADTDYEWMFQELQNQIDDVFASAFYFHENSGAYVNIEKIITDDNKEAEYLKKYAYGSSYKIFVYINTAEKAYSFLKKYIENVYNKKILEFSEQKKIYILYTDKNKKENSSYVQALRKLAKDISYNKEHITFCNSLYDSNNESLEMCLKYILMKINDCFSSNWYSEYVENNDVIIPEGEYYG